MLGLAGGTAVSPATAQAQGLNIENITGTITNRAGHAIGTFEGSLSDLVFAVENGQVVATGLLEGDVLNRGGNVITSISREVTLPLTDLVANPAPGVCQVLNLSLGPIDLNLLGLVLHVDEINLDLTANPAGGILGELLCDLAGGLDLGDFLGDLLGGLLGGSLLQNIVGLLNQVLGGLSLGG